MAPAFPGTENEGSNTPSRIGSISYTFIGTPVRTGASATREASTPLAELKARAIRVRDALAANLPRPPIVSTELVGRERELAEDLAGDYEPTSRDIMAAISMLSRSMVVREEIRAGTAESIDPLKHRLASM